MKNQLRSAIVARMVAVTTRTHALDRGARQDDQSDEDRADESPEHHAWLVPLRNAMELALSE
jgi:hypothetical protein